MKRQAVRDMLSKTLEDRRLSRGERRTLREVLASVVHDPEQQRMIISEAFSLVKDKVETPSDQSLVAWLEDLVQLTTSIDEHAYVADVCFSQQDDCAARLVGLLDRAKRMVDVCVFTITDNRIRDALLRAHERHIGLRVVTDDEKAFDQGSDIQALRDAGIAVRVDGSVHHMHHKFAIFDGSLVLTGSYNWTVGAARYNQENFIVSSDERLVSRFESAFDRLWDRFGG